MLVLAKLCFDCHVRASVGFAACGITFDRKLPFGGILFVDPGSEKLELEMRWSPIQKRDPS